jgi:hypothetical protein
LPVDGRNGPRQAETEEHVDRIAARDVADRIVGRFLVLGRNPTRKRVRQTCTQGNESRKRKLYHLTLNKKKK